MMLGLRLGAGEVVGWSVDALGLELGTGDRVGDSDNSISERQMSESAIVPPQLT